GYAVCVPEMGDRVVESQPFIDFSSGYVRRSIDKFPKQGPHPPWRLFQNYALDVLSLRFRELEDGVLRFTPAPAQAPALDRVAAANLDLAEGRELGDGLLQALARRIGDQEHGAAVLGKTLEARGGVGDVADGRVLDALLGAHVAGHHGPAVEPDSHREAVLEA